MKRIFSIFIAGIVLALVVFLAYVLFQTNFLNGSRIKEVTAVEFKDERLKEISILQEKGFIAWNEAKLYIVDIRSREDYAKGHLKGAVSSTPESARKNIGMPEGVDVVIYSSSSDSKRVSELANAITNGLSREKMNDSKTGQIVIIKDGYEGLKSAGFEIEEKIWD